MFTTNDWNICVIRTGLSLLLQPYFEERFSLVASLFPLSVFLTSVFARRARQKSSRSFPGTPTFSWLFLFPAKGIWNRAKVRRRNNNSGVLWGRRSDRVSGFVPLVAGGSSAIPAQGTWFSSKQLVTLRWDSSGIMFIKYVTAAGKQASFPELVCSNRCCGRFQASFPKHSSNSIVCNNSGWFFIQIFISYT